MPHKYLLKWLESTVSETFSPGTPDKEVLSREHMHFLTDKIHDEVLAFKAGLTDQVFKLRRGKEVRLLIAKYHEAMVALISILLENREAPALKEGFIQDTLAILLSALEEALSFIEMRFAAHLNPSEEVEPNYLAVIKSELKKRLEDIREAFVHEIGDKELSNIVVGNLTSFLSTKRHKHITLGEVLYRKELIKEMEQLLLPDKQPGPEALNEMLIYMNFNSTACSHFYSRFVAKQINVLTTTREKIEQLKACIRDFTKLYSNKNLALYPGNENLKTIIKRWLKQQFINLAEKDVQSVVPLGDKAPQDAVAVRQDALEKILCRLSSDQIALIFCGRQMRHG